ncbi:MAG TPA: HD domain-containing phosphohydrolase [Candidatus Elarobacter sp.]|nr:HD domain-containing phosphohydrolase [Candidatus Elarobacter sp.]
MTSAATLLEGALAEQLQARIAHVRTGGDGESLVAWIGEIARAYGDVPGLQSIVEAAARDLGLLGEGMRDAVRAAHPVARASDSPLDELDARIDALIVRLESRDPLSSEHSRAVASWCGRLGRRLGLDASEIAFASRCGLLHDVGKALTPLEVLNAPRALDEREWRIMRAHAAAGEALVMRVPELHAFAPAVRSHHERLDGRGYPDGLRLGQIPLMARVVAVADCFNAMIGRRPYRLPMSPTRALEELLRSRGTQLDPEIVDAMVDVVIG